MPRFGFDFAFLIKEKSPDLGVGKVFYGRDPILYGMGIYKENDAFLSSSSILYELLDVQEEACGCPRFSSKEGVEAHVNSTQGPD